MVETVEFALFSDTVPPVVLKQTSILECDRLFPSALRKEKLLYSKVSEFLQDLVIYSPWWSRFVGETVPDRLSPRILNEVLPQRAGLGTWLGLPVHSVQSQPGI